MDQKLILNIKDIRKNTKDSTLLDSSQFDLGTRATPPFAPKSFTSSSVSPIGDIAPLVSLQDGTTSSVAVATQEVVKTNEILKASAGPDIRYAKITSRRTTKNLSRKKLNFDFVVENSTTMNKITFSTTPEGWEWFRDIRRDYESGKLTEQDWLWYNRVYDRFQEAKKQEPRVTIGKGMRRATKTQRGSKPVKRTAVIYTTSHTKVYIGDWEYVFEMEAITSGRAENYYDSHAEFRKPNSDYEDLSWE